MIGDELMICKAIKILLTTILLFTVVACTKDNETGPIETASKMKQSIFFNNYEDFKSLFIKEKTEVTKELFNKLKEIDDSRADFKSYSLITLGNGQMILINHTPGNDYEIQDVIIVSDEMKELLKSEVINP